MASAGVIVVFAQFPRQVGGIREQVPRRTGEGGGRGGEGERGGGERGGGGEGERGRGTEGEQGELEGATASGK